jgi:hypothetical protein
MEWANNKNEYYAACFIVDVIQDKTGETRFFLNI